MTCPLRSALCPCNLCRLHMAVTLGSISAALLGFASGSSTDDSKSSGVGYRLVELMALILLPVGIAMCGYAIHIFIWRARNIAKKRAVQVRTTCGVRTPLSDGACGEV